MLKSIHSQRYRKFLGLLKSARLNAGVTQVELAARIGVTQSVVSKMETGERRVDVIETLEICDALGASKEDFLKTIVRTIGQN